jgi:hypothetical protein
MSFRTIILSTTSGIYLENRGKGAVVENLPNTIKPWMGSTSNTTKTNKTPHMSHVTIL